MPCLQHSQCQAGEQMLRSQILPPQKQDKSPSPVQMRHGSSSLCTEAAVFWVPSSQTPTGTLRYFSIFKRVKNRRWRNIHNHFASSYIYKRPKKKAKESLFKFTADWAWAEYKNDTKDLMSHGCFANIQEKVLFRIDPSFRYVIFNHFIVWQYLLL